MDAEILVLRARAILTEESDAVMMSVEKLHALIPLAIKELQSDLWKTYPEKLSTFFVSHTVTAAGGIADLSAKSNAGLRLDMLKSATIRATLPDETKEKVRLVNSLDRFEQGGIQDRNYVIGCLDGLRLLICDNLSDVEDSYTSFDGDITIFGVTAGNSVENFSDELLPDLAKAMAMIAKMEIQTKKTGVDLAARKS